MTSNQMVVRSVDEAQKLQLSYPVEVRAVFTLKNHGAGVAYDPLALIGLVKVGLDASPTGEVQINSGDSSAVEMTREPEPIHSFKNFHRQLCERFGYAHDEVEWQRDQVSLIEHIAKRCTPVETTPSRVWDLCAELRRYFDSGTLNETSDLYLLLKEIEAMRPEEPTAGSAVVTHEGKT